MRKYQVENAWENRQELVLKYPPTELVSSQHIVIIKQYSTGDRAKRIQNLETLVQKEVSPTWTN